MSIYKSLGFLCLSASVFAGADFEERLSKLESEMKEVSVTNVAGTTGAQFAGSGHHSKDHQMSWFVSADILYWHAKSGGTDWAVVSESGVYPINGYIKRLEFDWDWGFRVGIGMHFNHDEWFSQAVYTRYHTADSSKVAKDFDTPIGTDAPEGNPGPSGRARGTFQEKINYDAIDLELGRGVYVSKSFLLIPRFGLKSVWLDQKQKLFTEAFVDASETFFPATGDVNTNGRFTCNLWGMGPKIGTEIDYFMDSRFYLAGLVEGALLFGYFKVKEHQDIYVAPNDDTPTSTYFDLTGNTHRFVPHARMFLGLGYGDHLKENKYYLSGSLGYEVNYFFRVNQMLYEGDSSPPNVDVSFDDSVRYLIRRISDDVSFHGVTLRLSLEY